MVETNAEPLFSCFFFFLIIIRDESCYCPTNISTYYYYDVFLVSHPSKNNSFKTNRLTRNVSMRRLEDL